MAGTITVSTISDGSVSTSSTNCIQGSAKAWVYYNGATNVVNSSYNISSVTNNGTGDYTLNFTNAFSDANYSIVVGTSAGLSTAGTTTIKAPYTSAPTTTAMRFRVSDSGTGTNTNTYIYLALFR
jgi:hypothetical protein